MVLFENDITALKGIENSIGLKHLNLSSNKLKTFQDLGSLLNLNHLSFENNQLSNVPKLNYSSLQYVGLGVNKLTFEDLMPFSTLNLSVDSFPKFGTQSKQEAASTLTKNEQGTWTWTLGFDQKLTNNVYHWYKNDEEINTSTTGELKLTNIALSDSGVYRCEVENTNPFFAGIKLLTESKTLKVNKGVVAPQCFKLTNVLENQIIKKCIHESRVTLKAETTGLLNGELTYVLITNKDTLKSNSGEFEIKKEGIKSSPPKRTLLIKALGFPKKGL